jgi:hypothetical protein
MGSHPVKPLSQSDYSRCKKGQGTRADCNINNMKITRRTTALALWGWNPGRNRWQLGIFLIQKGQVIPE